MTLGKDFFLFFRFAIAIIKLFADIFGDESDKDEAKKNGF